MYPVHLGRPATAPCTRLHSVHLRTGPRGFKSTRDSLVRCHPPQIANPSPGGGRINLQYRRVECAPPSDLVVNVDANDGGDRWIRLSIQVRFAGQG